MNKAVDIWNDLRRRFAQRDPHRISRLQYDIYALKQGNLSINDYYTKCKSLWEEMSALRPLPICKCEPCCSCNLMDEIRKDQEIDQIIRFLEGLNEDYNSLKSGILVLDPLPDIHKVYVMAEKHERQLNIANLSIGGLEISHANAAKTSTDTVEELSQINANAVNYSNGKRYMNTTGSSKNIAKCTFCGMTGHTIEKCYKKHGYPPGWIPGFKSKGKQQLGAATTNTEQIQNLITLLQSQIT
ncbi:uncharacterized protein LOC116026925 [Ipomoea triloba]|uniref:uncharacterized protein LOC116026925 n=1 Tax=Ipomoea triloba TaxID=35885 RepID=UPI00125E1DC8|nr:uncharacterized protein LOC116026925 [Ipomoea triloba]